MKRVLVTCPPMLGQIDRFDDAFKAAGFDVCAPEVIQTLSEESLIKMLPEFDGWIIGDDPATDRVFTAAAKGRLKAAVKWGIGVDNVDFAAAERLDLKIINTPGVFGAEVADLAMHYVTGLARQTYAIDRGIRLGDWPKPAGRSLAGRRVGLVGFGDIGQHFATRAAAADMNIVVYDPAYSSDRDVEPYSLAKWPERLEDCDVIVLTCALTNTSRRMVNRDTLRQMNRGVQLVNVARGGLIEEEDLIDALQSEHVGAAALDVFEQEPLPSESPLRSHPRCIFGSHNGSNTVEAVERASLLAITKLSEFLGS